MALSLTWDLDSVFPGGSRSKEFKEYREKARKDLAELSKQFTQLPSKLDSSTFVAWTSFTLRLQEVCERLELITSFGHCLVSQNVEDSEANAIETESDLFWAEALKMIGGLGSLAMNQPEAVWKEWLKTSELKDVEFFLTARREIARTKMAQPLEDLALELGVDGYDAWNRIYTKMAGELKVEFDETGKAHSLSLGQLSTKMGSPDREVRRRAFQKMEEAWESRADLAAMTLNSLAGYRLTLYTRRKWKSSTFEALQNSNLSEASLDAMWAAVKSAKSKLAPFVEAKKKLLKIDRFSWWDQVAPAGRSEKVWTYDEAADFVIRQTATFSEDLSKFCKMAIEKRWVEAEDRPGKIGGAYCTALGPKRESRVFMTFGKTYDSLLTLAHELGHAYHSYVLSDLPYLSTWSPMTLAETASIFTESLVTDAALSEAKSDGERLFLLNQKLDEAMMTFCNIHTRYIFEKAFYEERRRGFVPRDRLDALMLKAQKEAFAGMLEPADGHRLFWASKLHFHISQLAYYNFPYTFGHLFAVSVYARAKSEGKGFAKKYAALLGDTGKMTCEEVARKHLDADITDEKFWAGAAERSLDAVPAFVELAGRVK